MNGIVLSSTRNPLLKTFRLAAAQSRRVAPDLALAEGIRILEEVVRSGRTMIAAVLSEDFGKTPRQEALLTALATAHVRTYRASDRVFRSISSVPEPQGAIALVRMPPASLKDIDPGTQAVVLFACGIQDPGNLGTLIRSAAAAGCSLVCTTTNTTSVRNPKAIRASAGAFFRLPLAENAAPAEVIAYCRKRKLQVFRTDARSGLEYFKADLRSPFALLLGNEAHGFPADEWLDFPALRIPMAGAVESLNVAAAGAVVLFEACRQRSAALNRQ